MDRFTPDEALARQRLQDHYRRPRNRGRVDEPDFEVQSRNPLCVGPGHERGDRVHLQVRLARGRDPLESRVEAVRFTGEGCTLSQAAASLTTQALEDRSAGEVLDWGPDEIEQLVGLSLSATRMLCAELSIRAFRRGLQLWRHRRTSS